LKLVLYVHDLQLEVGHSNSLIELVRHLPADVAARFTELEVLAYTCGPLDKLFPTFLGRARHVRVPGKGLRPVLAKALFYEAWCGLHRFFDRTPAYRIGVGISYGGVDAVSIQFIHHQWTKPGLALERPWSLRRAYKRLLFGYFEQRERALFLRRGVKFFSPAAFLTAHLRTHNPAIDAHTIYSGVDMARFRPDPRPRTEILADLIPRYPALAGLDVTKPVYLFVGAYERKGLAAALALVVAAGGGQFIVVGSPSAGVTPVWPAGVEVFRVAFTREIPAFYALADAFIFPTSYEPFGLVLFEAMAMGLVVVTRRQDVGASELLAGLPGVYFCDSPGFAFPEIASTSPEIKAQLRELRLGKLGDVSWSKAGAQLAEVIFGHSVR
jgi:glycosyltransferase involved in cell wall biosynthesis